jgi:hypothetical protein
MPTIKIVPMPGVLGPQGPRGLQGIQGETGLTGPIGPAGPAGEESGPKTWTAPNDADYAIYQAHGGVEVSTDAAAEFYELVTVTNDQTNSSTLEVTVSNELDLLFTNIQNLPDSFFFRGLEVNIGGNNRVFTIGYQNGANTWVLYAQGELINVFQGNTLDLYVAYGGAPIKWWDADNLGFMPEGEEWKFRGAKVDYHAYSTDSGSLVGTIYIASDSGNNNVTHIETGSGSNDLGTVHLWNRHGNERQLYVYRKDNESSTTRIQWTAQVYYGTEIWD